MSTTATFLVAEGGRCTQVLLYLITGFSKAVERTFAAVILSFIFLGNL